MHNTNKICLPSSAVANDITRIVLERALQAQCPGAAASNWTESFTAAHVPHAAVESVACTYMAQCQNTDIPLTESQQGHPFPPCCTPNNITHDAATLLVSNASQGLEKVPYGNSARLKGQLLIDQPQKHRVTVFDMDWLWALCMSASWCAGMLHATSGRNGFRPTLGSTVNGSRSDGNEEAADCVKLAVHLPCGSTFSKSCAWSMPHAKLVEVVQRLNDL